MLTKITYAHLKKSSGTHALAPLTLIAGSNFTGKTTILDAVKLALLGYHPSLGKTNTATFALSSADRMSVRAHFDGGQLVEREWKEAGKSIKGSVAGEVPIKDALMILSPELFIGATPKARLTMLAELASLPGGEDFAKMEESADKLEQTAREHKADRLRLEKTMAGIADLINAAGVPAKPVATAGAALEEAIRALKGAQDRLGQLEERAEAADDAREELATLPPVQPVADFTAAYAAASATVGALKSQQMQLTRPAGPYPYQGEAEELKVMKAGVQDGVEWLTAHPEAEADSESVALLRDAINSEKRMVTAIESIQAKIDGMEALTCCPTCKAKKQGWKSEVLRGWDAEKIEIERSRQLLLEGTPAIQRRADTYAQANQIRQYVTSSKERLAAYDAAVSREAAAVKYLETADALARDIAKAETEMKNAAVGIAAAQANAKAAKRRETLQAIVDAAPSTADVQAAAAAVAAAEGAEDAARRAVTAETEANHAWNEAAQREKDLTETRAEMEKADSLASEFADKAKEKRVKMKEAMGKLFGPILKVAEPLSEEVMGRKLSMDKDGEIGVQSGVSFIPFAALSGTEQLIATIAIQAGLSAGAGGIVLIDELSRVDAARKRTLALALQRMVKAGTLRQVIAIDHDAEFSAAAGASGWEVIHV